MAYITPPPPNKIKLVINESGLGNVWLNGKEVENVTKVTFQCQAGEPTEVVLYVFAEVDAEIGVEGDPRAFSKPPYISANDVRTMLGLKESSEPLSSQEVEEIKLRWNAQFK